MPFETTFSAPRRIAVIGAGISDLGAAHRLARDHRVTLWLALAAAAVLPAPLRRPRRWRGSRCSMRSCPAA